MIENVSTQLTVFHCFAHCLLPGRAFASLYALLFLEKEAEIGGRDSKSEISMEVPHCRCIQNIRPFPYKIQCICEQKTKHVRPAHTPKFYAKPSFCLDQSVRMRRLNMDFCILSQADHGICIIWNRQTIC